MKRVLTLFLFLLLALPCASPAASLDFGMAPGVITISTFYNGTNVTVSGAVPDGAQVVVRFSGVPEKVAMKQKGKAFGLLWMNMNTLHFSGVPKVFLVESSAPLKDLGVAGPSIGLTGLMDKIGIEPDTADRSMLLPELVKLKKSEGLYREGNSAVTLGDKSGELRQFTAKMAIPSRLSPGSYALEVFAVKDGVILAQASQPLDAKMTGIPALMADLAFNHAVWYGILASVIAIMAGLGIGLVFQSKGAH
ncbi:MAG: TIGR02186 family protein [Humidesulfovibrio sp.]|nr:TIGR02186 family protein [Humidesulfovibrio sp.]